MSALIPRRKLRDEFISVAGVTSQGELLDQLLRFSKSLGFHLASAIAVRNRLDGALDCFSVENAPQGYQDMYFDPRAAQVDPVCQHCKRHNVPIVWDQQTYVDAGQAAKWEHQSAFGYKTGLALAIHLPNGLHFMVGVDRDQPLPACSTEVTRLAADLSLFTMHAIEPALGLLVPRGVGTGPPELTARELETLRWTMDGKTAWEVGAILSISEQTAARHLNNATRKLDCANKHHAVVKALRLGLLQ